ncbi:unnamed protein product [Rotaria socialis]
MSSKSRTQTGKVFIPQHLASKIQNLLAEMSRSVNPEKKYKPIMATLTTSERSKTKVNLNICRPLNSSHSNRIIPKETLKRNEDLEDLIIVWLDQHMNETESEFITRKRDLRQVIDCLIAFNDIDKCFAYIKSIEQEKIFFIVSGALGRNFMDDLNDYSQIIFIYFYCSNENYYRSWKKNYKKVVGAFATEHELITQITSDVSSFFQNILPISVINSIDITEKSTRDLTKSQAQFMWSQILMEILLDLPQTPESKQDFIDECRRRYKNNVSQQTKITEFEKTYKPSNALSWYATDSFLYRIVNKALRTQNIIYIFKCRFFIIDVYQQLKTFYSEFIKNFKKNTFTVFRGQSMAADEFSKLQKNINGFISINSFFSTSLSSAVSLPYTGEGKRRPLFESVLFEIELKLDINTVPFADIAKESHMKSENEVLLCMGAIFRIESIDKRYDDLWHVKLISVDRNDNSKLAGLKNYLKNETNETLTCLALGKILQKMGEYDKAQALYEILLAELPSNHLDIAGLYNDFGMTIFKTQKDSKMVLSYLIQSLQLQMKTFPKYFLCYTRTLSNIASVYCERRNFKRSLSLLHVTLQILDLDVSTNNSNAIASQRSEICNNIGQIYFKLGQLSLSLKYLKISLKIERKILPVNHPDIALTLNNIGTIYLGRLDYEKAGKSFEEAVEIVEECLTLEQHADIAQLYNNIGLIEYNRDNLDKALLYYDKALTLQLKCLPSIHWQTAAVYNNMGHIFFEKVEYKIALKMFQKSLNIGEQCQPSNHPEISHIHQNIGKVYRALKDYPRALIHCINAVQIGLKCLPSTDSYIAEAYRGLARVYNDLENYPVAMQNFQKALDIYVKKPPIDKKYLATLYEDIGIGYYNSKQYHDSLKNLQKAVKIFRNCDSTQYDECVNKAQELIKEIMGLQST